MNNITISSYRYTSSNFWEFSRLVGCSIHFLVSLFMNSSYQLTEIHEVPLMILFGLGLFFYQEGFLKFISKVTEVLWSCGHCTSLVSLHHVTVWSRRKNQAFFLFAYDESCQVSVSKPLKL